MVDRSPIPDAPEVDLGRSWIGMFVRSWPALLFGFATLLAGLYSGPDWSGGSAGQVPRLAVQETGWAASVGPRWVRSGPDDGAGGGPSGGSDSGGSDSGGGSDAGSSPPSVSGSSGSSSGDSGSKSGGDAPKPAAKSSGPDTSPSDGDTGSGSGDPAVTADRPGSTPDGDNGSNAGRQAVAAPDARAESGTQTGAQTGAQAGAQAGAEIGAAADPGSTPAGSTPARVIRPDGTTEQTPTGATASGPQRATGPQQATVSGSPGQAAPGDPGAPVPENLKTLFAPTTRPGTTPGATADATGAPSLPTTTLLGQGNDPATGQAFYHHLVGTDGAAAGRLRSLDDGQLQQLAAQGPPRTAEQVIDIATGIPSAAPRTRQEHVRQLALQEWLGNSTEPPADFQALASALPAAEREKLEQTFEAYTPGNLANPGAISSWGRQASTWVRETMARADRERTSTVIAGSWPDRVNRSGAKFFADLPEGTATALEHLFMQDQMTGGNPFSTPTPLIGETEEQAYQRTHPFDQDLKAMAQSYSNDLAPIAKENDWSKLGNRFYNDPVGATAAYLPIGPPSAKLGKNLARADQALVNGARARLAGQRGPPAAASSAAAAPDAASPPGAASNTAASGAAASDATSGAATSGSSGSTTSGAIASGSSGSTTSGSGSTSSSGSASSGSTGSATSGTTTESATSGGAATRRSDEAPQADPVPDVAAPNPALAAAAPESVPSGSLAGQPGGARPPSTTAADGEKAVEAIKRGDMPAAAKFLAPRPAEAPSDAVSSQSTARPGSRPSPEQVGAARESKVAELTNGRVIGLPGQEGMKISRPGVGSTDVDVIGSDGSYIAVGGPAKATKLLKTVEKLNILKWKAEQDGVAAKAYFEEGTPDAMIKAAEKTLGRANVVVFAPPDLPAVGPNPVPAPRPGSVEPRPLPGDRSGPG